MSMESPAPVVEPPWKGGVEDAFEPQGVQEVKKGIPGCVDLLMDTAQRTVNMRVAAPVGGNVGNIRRAERLDPTGMHPSDLQPVLDFDLSVRTYASSGRAEGRVGLNLARLQLTGDQILMLAEQAVQLGVLDATKLPAPK